MSTNNRGTTRRIAAFGAFVLLPAFAAACRDAAAHEESYQSRRASFRTELLYERRTSRFAADTLPDPTRTFPDLPGTLVRTRYPSGDDLLEAWLYTPPPQPGVSPPTLLFLHAGYQIFPDQQPHLRPFLDAGFIVMWPTYRGEHGNPGSFEELLGEVDDAAAAARWLARQPGVDPDRIWAMGWSIGGGIAALLSLIDDVPLRHTASSGGLYGPHVLRRWAAAPPRPDGLAEEPFDPDRPGEIDLRVLPGNYQWMKRPHFAFIETAGNPDTWTPSIRSALHARAAGDTLIHVLMVPGNHFTAFPTAVRRYLEMIRREDS